MCVLKFNDAKKQAAKMINRSNLGPALRGVLMQAKVEGRLICGLLPAIAHLEDFSEDVLFCVLPQTRPGDSATHIQTVLLQAFCYENGIPVIQVNSSEKLAEYCGPIISDDHNKHKPAEYFCALITKDANIPSSPEEEEPTTPLSPCEQVLTEFYENTMEEFPRPIIELPR